MRTGQDEFGEGGVVTVDDVSLAENAKLKLQAFLVEADNVLAAARNRRERLSRMIRTNRRIKIIPKVLGFVYHKAWWAGARIDHCLRFASCFF